MPKNRADCHPNEIDQRKDQQKQRNEDTYTNKKEGMERMDQLANARAQVKNQTAMLNRNKSDAAPNYTVTVHVSSKGQMVIPAKMRRLMGIRNEGGRVTCTLVDGQVIIKNESLLNAEELYGFFNESEDNQDFTLDIHAAREERADTIMKKMRK